MQIRQMELQDMEKVTVLCAQWGYSTPVDKVTERFHQMSRLPESQLLVAVEEGEVCGWVQAQAMHSLGSEPYVEVKGLVVDEQHRKKGVGRQLILAVEKWTIEQGYAIIRLRSSVDRQEAHHFYPSIGFERTKSQHVYQKRLNQSQSV